MKSLSCLNCADILHDPSEVDVKSILDIPSQEIKMKVVILAGGFGTRISEHTETIPKPMVTIGDKPILWHIMKRYADFGYKEFYIALGYKSEIVKEYFNYKIKCRF